MSKRSKQSSEQDGDRYRVRGYRYDRERPFYTRFYTFRFDQIMSMVIFIEAAPAITSSILARQGSQGPFSVKNAENCENPEEEVVCASFK
jgi:hypothetical protein